MAQSPAFCSGVIAFGISSSWTKPEVFCNQMPLEYSAYLLLQIPVCCAEVWPFGRTVCSGMRFEVPMPEPIRANAMLQGSVILTEDERSRSAGEVRVPDARIFVFARAGWR